MWISTYKYIHSLWSTSHSFMWPSPSCMTYISLDFGFVNISYFNFFLMAGTNTNAVGNVYEVLTSLQIIIGSKEILDLLWCNYILCIILFWQKTTTTTTTTNKQGTTTKTTHPCLVIAFKINSVLAWHQQRRSTSRWTLSNPDHVDTFVQ